MASKTISGVFGGKGTPAVGSWDAMHTFATRSSDKFGGKMHAGAGWAGGQVGKALQEFYNTEKLNPCITSIKITVNPKEWTTAWEVTIDESPDGKAYVALGSWGGASGGYPAKKPPGNWAYSNYVKEKKSVAARYAKTEIKDVIDFYFPGGFRQIFFQYTIPSKFPDLPKSATAKKGTVGVKIGASGSPTGLPEYNGMVMPTVTIEPDPIVLKEVKTENTEEIPKNPDPIPIQAIPGPPNPLLVTGKISLKVKSGPGVIIGITDVDIVEGKADFSGIQFDQAGDYVITISSTSPEIGPTELKLTILPEPTVIPQDPKGTEEESDATGTRPIIAQIDPPGRLPSMEFGVDEVPMDATDQVAQTIGNLPFFNFNGSVINDRDIEQMSLFHEGIMPKVKITFRDSNNLLSKNPPQDDTKFEIFINPKSDNLKPIHLRFKVEDFQKLQNNAYTITGTIDIPELYRMKFKVYRGTSFEAIRKICKDLKMGLNSNIENTTDEMPWRNIGDRPYKFIADIIKHSYISEESFMAGYIDFYYCFNYVDIEKEMKRDIKADMGIETGSKSDEKDSKKIVPMKFSSDKGLQSSSFYFSKTGQKNDSTKISMQQGYKTRTKFYDKVKKMFLVFDVDSTTSDASKTIILKGANGDKESFDNNYVTKYSGKIDTDNVHKNHNYAVTQNSINLDNMMKNQLDIKFPNPNFNIYKFQKIEVMVVKEISTISSDEPVEWRYSGEWMILDIVYDFSGGKLSQDVKLVRKEMGKNPAEMENDKNQVVPESKDPKNENPIVGSASETITNKPNNVYKVDETYTVQDANGKRYILTIKKLSENGIEVVADLKDIDYVPKTDNPETIIGVTKTEVPVVETTPPITATGSYWPSLIFDQWQDDMPQSRVTSITGYYEMWAPGYSKYLDKYANISPSSGLWIAIQKPVPNFKPEGTEKKQTPFKWILYKLSDEGTSIGTKDGSKKHEIIRSRLLEEYERGLNTWKKPKGYIRVLDPTGAIVIDSDNGDTNSYTGTPYIQGSSLVDKSYFDWFESRTSIAPIPSGELYTEVGGPNTIFIDMSNSTKFQPGTYTLEVKYIVPKFGEFGTERILEPKDSDGNNPYEEKIFKKTFTISKKSKSR